MRIVNVHVAERAYPIFIGPKSREQLRNLIREAPGVQKIAVIADQTVAKLHLETLLAALDTKPSVFQFAPGERQKSIDTAQQLYDQFADERIGRRDIVLTFGGGVAGDLGGFVAATWLRGIRFIQIPTTLEAAIDASVGGKTGVNHRAGKNLIGAFHQPRAVVIDTDFLTTLPDAQFVSGLAESVKHAVIRDESLLSWQEDKAEAILARDTDTLEELITRNCEIKAEVVARDEREHDLRMILNYGHTIGHAIEHVLDYELSHGECVGLGIVAENEIAVSRGLLSRDVADRIARLLTTFGLPTRLPREIAAASVIEACLMDKKVRKGVVQFVLVRNINDPIRVDDVTEQEIADALKPLAPC